MGTWQYITNPSEFLRLMVDRTKQLNDFHIVNEDTIQVSWCHDEGFEPDSLMTNEVIATMTTSWARLELYKVLDFLGERVLYFDTGKQDFF